MERFVVIRAESFFAECKQFLIKAIIKPGNNQLSCFNKSRSVTSHFHITLPVFHLFRIEIDKVVLERSAKLKTWASQWGRKFFYRVSKIMQSRFDLSTLKFHVCLSLCCYNFALFTLKRERQHVFRVSRKLNLWIEPPVACWSRFDSYLHVNFLQRPWNEIIIFHTSSSRLTRSLLVVSLCLCLSFSPFPSPRSSIV